MQRKLIILLVVFGFSVAFAQSEATKYGSEITLSEKTNISEILANPDSFIDKEVLVEGEIMDVCPMMGCWMELKSDKADEKIKIKVNDGEIVFPTEAVGSTAKVEGKVYKIELTKEKAIDHFEHISEEKGEKFDPSTITGPVTIYQIKGSGAEIQSNKN